MTSPAPAHAEPQGAHRDAPATSPPIKVLHIITRLVVGGAMENTVLTAIGQHQDPRFDVTLVTGIDPGPEGDLFAFTRAAGVKLVIYPHLRRPIHPVRDIRSLLYLARFIRRGGYDVVHTHTSKAGILGRLAGAMARTPLVVHTLHSLVFHDYQSPWVNRSYILLKKLCAPLTHQFISVCAATQRGAVAAGIGRPDRHATVFSGMDLAPFQAIAERQDTRADKERFGLPSAVPVVGKIARLFKNKGHEQFIDVAERVHRQRPGVHFLLVGDGVLRRSLEAKVVARGLERVFHFAGLLEPHEVPGALAAMDVVVHASVREGIARVLPQALAAGRPPVVFDLDGAPEVVEDGKSGFVVAPLDVDAMATRVIQLVDDPELRRRLVSHGQAFVAREFPTERMVERINQLYLDGLADRRSRR